MRSQGPRRDNRFDCPRGPTCNSKNGDTLWEDVSDETADLYYVLGWAMCWNTGAICVSIGGRRIEASHIPMCRVCLEVSDRSKHEWRGP